MKTSVHPLEITRVAPAHKATPAPGLIVDRPFPGPTLDRLDPFLMLDHFGPDPIRAGDTGGLNPHPHRGFETVTVMLEGSMEHHDSQGNRGVIQPGGVQWMTAARGIVHAEYRGQELVQSGGTLHGLQLWVNLPRRFKMNPPGYQDLGPERIAEVPVDGAVVRVIAGEYRGRAGPARTFTPLGVFHLRLDVGGKVDIPVAEGWNAGAYLIRGAVQANGRPLREREMAVFAQAGGDIEIVADAPGDVLVLAGEPIGEPVVSWGPFVMSTREEIVQAQRDYALGRMGSLPDRV